VGGYLSGEVLKDGGEVDGSAGADASSVPTLLQVATDTANGELEPGLHGPRYGLLPGTAGLTPGRSLLHLPASSDAGGVHGLSCASRDLFWTRRKGLCWRNAGLLGNLQWQATVGI
jgi:hypothetical protein